MPGPTDPNDSSFKNSGHHVFVNGRWQYVENQVTANAPAEPGQGYIRATSLGTGDFFDPNQGHNISRADLNNVADWNKIAIANSQRQPVSNPYSNNVADQARPALMALVSQMRAQQSGPSLAGLQGQAALGHLGQQALASGPMQGRAAMLQAAQGSRGVAGDVGQARLAEVIRAQTGLGGLAGAMRGNALSSADQGMQSALAARALQDQMARHYAELGNSSDIAMKANNLEARKLQKRFELGLRNTDANTTKDAVQGMATVASMGG